MFKSKFLVPIWTFIVKESDNKLARGSRDLLVQTTENYLISFIQRVSAYKKAIFEYFSGIADGLKNGKAVAEEWQTFWRLITVYGCDSVDINYSAVRLWYTRVQRNQIKICKFKFIETRNQSSTKIRERLFNKMTRKRYF